MKTLRWTLAIALLTLGPFVVHAQNPMMLRWDKAAPFPEPEEELYGVTAGGKMYVIGGFSENGKPAPAMVYEYDPAPTRGRRRSRSRCPCTTRRRRSSTERSTCSADASVRSPARAWAAGQPVDNSWEYDPPTDAWRALAPMPRSAVRRSPSRSTARSTSSAARRSMENSGETALFGNRPAAHPRHEPDVRPGDQHVDQQEPDADGAQPRVLGRGERQDLRDRRPPRRRARHRVEQHRRGRGIRSGARSVGRGQVAYADAAQRRRLGAPTTGASTSPAAKGSTSARIIRSARSRRTSPRPTAGSSFRRCRKRATAPPARSSATSSTW